MADTLSCQWETLHSQQLRSIKKSIDSDHGIYRDRREFITLLGGVSLLRNSRLAVILFAASLIILWGNAAMAMTLNSPAFQQNGHIPSKYTCEGEDVSPPLAWEGVPDGAKRNLSFPMPYQSPPFAFGASRTARQPTLSPKIVISKHAVPNPGRFSMLSPSTI